MSRPIALAVNGDRHEMAIPGTALLSDVLREELGLTGTKIGCGTGDCGACTVLVDDEAVCACLLPIGRLDGCHVMTVEGLAADPLGARLQRSFLRHAAAQCGFCTPGMLLAALALLQENTAPTVSEIEDALGGVLCRCTGYRAISRAVADVHTDAEVDLPPAGKAVGAAIPRVDGTAKVTGQDVFGADGAPADALVLKVVRCPYARARFTFGDLDLFRSERRGVRLVVTAADVPGVNRHGVLPAYADQPVFAEGHARFAGEAVAAVVFDNDADVTLDDFPILWEPLDPVSDPRDAQLSVAPTLHDGRDQNVLVRGHVARGDLDHALATSEVVVSGVFDTPFLEHAYIEPEAGWAEIVDGVVVIHASTQAPHTDRDATATILGLAPDRVRIRPTAVGGAFGGKLDLSVEPYVGLAAHRLGRAVRMVYDRKESMAVTTKRHPSVLDVRIGADRDGRMRAIEFSGTFDTGAYASWGPTVASRVPVHASGPYYIEHFRADSAAVHTNAPPSGAFRGFGVPQTAVALECLLDDLAAATKIDRLELRIRNALYPGQTTVTGQRLERAVGIRECLEALCETWTEAHDAIASALPHGRFRHGIGVAAIWYGCGNTAMTNPSTIKAGIRGDGSLVLHQGAVDLGQGSNTVLTQIFADALDVDTRVVSRAPADTDVTPDAGKSSASRQTYVSGTSALLAAQSLRRQLLALLGADNGHLEFDSSVVRCRVDGQTRHFDLAELPLGDDGYVLRAIERYDPPTTELDEQGQGSPYAVYTFGAQLAEVTVDTATGRVRLRRVTAAYDVGRAINPQLVTGQLEGGIAQGIGMALMEAYVPGRTDNLHDYLIPTIGDVPIIRTIVIESDDPHGPHGAKGVGEPALIGTAPAILNGIRHACGARITSLPATPERVLDAIRSSR